MISEFKILYRYFKDTYLLKVLPIGVCLFLLLRGGGSNDLIVIDVISIIVSFSILEFSTNLFGLDYNAFYIHLFSTNSIHRIIIKRLLVVFFIQAFLVISIGLVVYAKKDLTIFKYYFVLNLLFITTNISSGYALSFFFAKRIPRGLEKALFDNNRPIGTIVSILLNFIIVSVASYFFVRKMYAQLYTYMIVSIILIWIIILPGTVFITNRIIKKKQFKIISNLQY